VSHLSKSVSILMCAIGLAACSSPTIRISSTPPPDIDRSGGRPISASACGYQLFQLIPISTNSRQITAYERLKQQAASDYVGDVVQTEKWYYGLVGSVYCTEFTAKAYPRRAS
jgi:hypothetical protein